jgi:glycosyltransferase involved in cell wall biosynthesis
VYLEGYAGKLGALGELADLTLVTPADYPTLYGPAERPASNGAYRVASYPAVFPFWRRSSTRWVLLSADLGFRHARPEIVHVENERHSSIALQAVAARRLFAPEARLVVFVWDNHRSGLARERVTVPVGRWMAKRVDFFIAGNQGARALLVDDGVEPGRIAVAPATGVDLRTFRTGTAEERAGVRGELGIAAEEFVVGFVGRIEAEKGIRDLGAALEQLRENDGGPVRCLLIGRGSLLHEVSTWRGKGLRVTAVPPQPHAAVARYYRAMDAMVLASRTMPAWKEQFGRVLVEAMASGVPAIGSDSGAIPEVLGDSGLVFPEGDARALAAALERVRADSALREKLSQGGGVRVRDQFSDAAVARRTAAVYDAALSLPPVKAVP